jgi:hypothetical protein
MRQFIGQLPAEPQPGQPVPPGWFTQFYRTVKEFMRQTEADARTERPRMPAVKYHAITVAASNSSSGDKAVSYYVCDGTADNVEISNAIALLRPGGTLYLKSGTYVLASAVTIAQDINIACTADLPTTATITPASAVSFAFKFSSCTATISNITIDNAGASKFGVALNAEKSKITAFWLKIDSTSSHGINIDYCDFFGSYVNAENCGGNGIDSGHSQLALSLAVTSSNTGYGIYAATGCVDLASCTAHSNGVDGIYAATVAFCGYGLLCSNNTGRGVICRGSVTHSTCGSNGGVGITASYVAVSTAENNTGYGIVAETAIGCTASGNGTIDVQSQYGRNNTATNKTITDNADLTAGTITLASTTTITVAANGRITGWA